MTREIHLDVIRLRRYGWRLGIVALVHPTASTERSNEAKAEIEFEIRQNRRKESHAESE